MTSQNEMLKNIKPSKEQVTFGDGVEGKIIGSSTLNLLGMLKLDDVLLVQGNRARAVKGPV